MNRIVTAVVCLLPAMLAAQPHLEWATRLPGAGRIAATVVDSEGNTWVAGSTNATDLPVTPNALQPKLHGDLCNFFRWQFVPCADGFLAKWSPAGQPLYVSYFGRRGFDQVADLAGGQEGAVYALGCARPSDAPEVRGQCVSKLNADGSAAWSVDLGPGTGNAQKIAVDPTGSVFVAGATDATASDAPYGAAPARPTFYRQLAGGTWEPVFGTPRFRALGADVLDWRRLIARDAEGRFWRSTDAGSTWVALGGGGHPLIDAHLSVRGDTVYSGGLYRSDDGGLTFRELAGELPGNAIHFDPVRPGTLYAVGLEGAVFRSSDDGRTWKTVLDRRTRHVALTASGRLYAFGYGDGTRFVSDDAGESWRELAGGPRYPMFVVAGPGDRLLADDDTGVETSDSGAAWTETLSLPAQRPNALAGGRGAAYAVFLPALEDIWIARLASDGGLLWAKRFGGNGAERVSGLAVDSTGNAVVGGTTESADLPVAGAPVASRRGKEDGFLASFAAEDGRVLAATYAGTAASDSVTAVAAAGESVLAAIATAETEGAAPTEREAALFRYSGSIASPAELLRLPKSTIESISPSAAGDVWFAAATAAEGLAAADGWQQRAPGRGDVLLARVSQFGAPLWSTYYGGLVADSEPTVAAGPGGSVSLSMRSEVAPLAHPAFVSGPLVVARFGSAALPAPALPEHSVVNAGSFRAATEPGSAIAPGAIVAIFGEDLAAGVAHADSLPLPTTLLGTSVEINGRTAPLFYVSPQQVNAQVPWATEAGTARIKVRRGSEVTAERTVEVAGAAPGLWGVLVDPERGPIPYQHPKAGQRLLLYATGLGALEQPLADGTASAASDRTAAAVTADIDGVPVTVEYAGAAPGFAGLYQINIVLPATPMQGRLAITANGIRSNELLIWSQP